MTMQSQEKIYSYDLVYNGAPTPFVIKTMEEIDEDAGGIADNKFKNNFKT